MAPPAIKEPTNNPFTFARVRDCFKDKTPIRWASGDVLTIFFDDGKFFPPRKRQKSGRVSYHSNSQENKRVHNTTLRMNDDDG